jgi:hypothetical protein
MSRDVAFVTNGTKVVFEEALLSILQRRTFVQLEINFPQRREDQG